MMRVFGINDPSAFLELMLLGMSQEEDERESDMKTNTTAEAGVSTQVKDRFAIAWPTELDTIKPKFIIDVTPTRQAHIYEETRKVYPREGYNDKIQPYERTGYYVRFVMKKTGMLPLNEICSHNGYNDRNGTFCDSLREVKHVVEEYSATNQPKTKTVTQKIKVEVSGDEADDE